MAKSSKIPTLKSSKSNISLKSRLYRRPSLSLKSTRAPTLKSSRSGSLKSAPSESVSPALKSSRSGSFKSAPSKSVSDDAREQS